MGTRSTYRVIENGQHENKKWSNKLVLLYLQYDGYPDGHPVDTAEWLASGKVVNGLGSNMPEVVFNGAGCLAAQLVDRLKEGPGGAYIYPINHRGLCGEDYVYDIVVDSDKKDITFIAYDNNTRWDAKRASTKQLYKGTPAGFVEWVKNRK